MSLPRVAEMAVATADAHRLRNRHAPAISRAYGPRMRRHRRSKIRKPGTSPWLIAAVVVLAIGVALLVGVALISG